MRRPRRPRPRRRDDGSGRRRLGFLLRSVETLRNSVTRPVLLTPGAPRADMTGHCSAASSPTISTGVDFLVNVPMRPSGIILCDIFVEECQGRDGLALDVTGFPMRARACHCLVRSRRPRPCVSFPGKPRFFWQVGHVARSALSGKPAHAAFRYSISNSHSHQKFRASVTGGSVPNRIG